MTTEKIQARIADLEALRDRQLADLNATIGAIADCRWWLEQTHDDAEHAPPDADAQAAAVPQARRDAQGQGAVG